MAERAQSLEVLSMKVDQLSETQRIVSKQVDDIRAKLTLPPDGIFIKLSEITNHSDSMTEKLNDAHEELDKLIHVCELQTRQVMALESASKEHEKSLHKLHDTVSLMADTIKPIVQEYDRRMGIKKWTDKILWAIIALMLIGIVPILKTIFYDGIQKFDSRKVEELEEKVKKLEKLE